MNHSNTPNYSSDNKALRDIQPGEEIVDDYGHYQTIEWLDKLAEEYGEISCTQFAAKTKLEENIGK